jgi:hypothetical protein
VNSETIRDRKMDRKQLDAWLTAEQGGEEDVADAALAHLFAAVPKVQPRSVAFVEQTVTTAWRWRTRRRRLLAGAWTAAAALIIAGAAIAYSASPLLGGSAAKAIAFLTGHTVPWLIAYASVALHGWLTLGHVGSVVASALITPGRVAAVVGVELLGILAFYALHRIASAERLGDAQV